MSEFLTNDMALVHLHAIFRAPLSLVHQNVLLKRQIKYMKYLTRDWKQDVQRERNYGHRYDSLLRSCYWILHRAYEKLKKSSPISLAHPNAWTVSTIGEVVQRIQDTGLLYRQFSKVL